MTTHSTSAAAVRGPSGATAKRQWRVRTEKGDVFGPADLGTLKTWAQDGRLAPTHQVSEDEQGWIAVTSMPELEMNWVAEVTPGSFYGPIHKNAMVELVREGSINAAAPRFRRAMPDESTPSEREQQLEVRVRELQQQLSHRVMELESQLAAARGEQEQTRSALGARDLEFDAERQEQKASIARLQAELIKRDGRIAALEADMQRLEHLARERQDLETRLSEAERAASDHVHQAAQQREALDQSRHLQREAERTAAQMKERVANHARDTESLHESVRSLKLRLGSVRKLLQQANASLGGADDATDAEIVATTAPSSGTTQEGPPPLVTPNGGVKPGMSLADLEAQAQRELRQLGHKGGSLFKSRAKG